MSGKRTAVALAMATLALAGCSKTEREVSQSIMPAALNYYVLTQEISRLRSEVRGLPGGRLDETLPKYRDIMTRGQQMHLDLGQMKDIRRHQNLLAAMDSSLVTQLMFLQYEAQAVEAMVEYSRASSELERIERQTSGNTLARIRHQAELDQLAQSTNSSYRRLESLKPQLQSLGKKNLGEMRLYNQMVLDSKILTYVAADDLLQPFAWEQAKAEPKKTAAKKTSSKRNKRSGR